MRCLGAFPKAGSFIKQQNKLLLLFMAINKNRHDESKSTIKAAKQGVKTLGTPQRSKHDKSATPEQVQGGRETTDKNEWREARNVAMKGHVTNPGGNRKTSKNTKTAATSSSSATKPSAPVVKKKQSSKPTLEQVKKAAKPKPSITEIWSNLPQFKEKREQAAKHAREIERKRGYPQDHVGLVDLINGAGVRSDERTGLKQQQQVPSFGAEATAPTPPQAPQQTRQQLSPQSVQPQQEVEEQPQATPVDLQQLQGLMGQAQEFFQ